MFRRATRSPLGQRRRWWPTPSGLLSGITLFIVLGGSAVAATGLVQAGDIAPGAVTSKSIKNGAVELKDLSAATRGSLAGGPGPTGAKGDNGSTGSAGAKGEAGSSGTSGSNGANGPNGANGTNGTDGAKGLDGAKGADGPKGAEGAKGAEGQKGADGAKGAEGPKGAPGTNGTVTPLAAKQGLTALPTGSPSTIVVELAVPAGSYIVLAKSQLFQTGAGDSVECLLKSGATTLDQTAMKTLPALASVPASLQAVTTTTGSATTLTVQCSVTVANGTANYNSLIAIPTA
jgi:hypothetical protein